MLYIHIYIMQSNYNGLSVTSPFYSEFWPVRDLLKFWSVTKSFGAKYRKYEFVVEDVSWSVVIVSSPNEEFSLSKIHITYRYCLIHLCVSSGMVCNLMVLEFWKYENFTESQAN